VTHGARPLIGIPAGTPPGPDGTTYQLGGSYTAAVADAGGLPVIIPLGLSEPVLRDIFERLDGLLLAGGPDVDPRYYDEPHLPELGRVDAARDTVELILARWALAADLPLFGICRGIQLLNVAGGGSLYQDIATQIHPDPRHNYTSEETPRERPVHRVAVAPDSGLAAVLGACDVPVNSYHHQAVKRAADGFAVVAHSEDGVIEGIENPALRYALGVQWHPEGMFKTDRAAQRLFSAFVAAARRA
jgi:putative glutamine amidotransferase